MNNNFAYHSLTIYSEDKIKKLLSSILIISAITSTLTMSYGQSYTVKKGDRLWKIAREYGTTIDDLVNLNHIANRDLIYIGQKLMLPDGKPAPVQSRSMTKELWAIEGFELPESVLTIPGHDYLYVSNTKGTEMGYISKITKDGKMVDSKWVNDIHTPTGMGYYDGFIYAVDESKVHVIDIDTGIIVKTIPSEAKSLNDLTITDDGQVFISDFLTRSIYTIENDRLVKWLQLEDCSYPNGLLAKGKWLYVGDLATDLSWQPTPEEYGSLYRVDIESRTSEIVKNGEKIGTIDGIASYNNHIIISAPYTGRLIQASDDGATVLGQYQGGIADITSDQEKGIIYGPFLFTNKVSAYQITETRE